MDGLRARSKLVQVASSEQPATCMASPEFEKQVEWLVRKGQRLLTDSPDSRGWSGLSSWQKSLLDEQLRLRHRSRKRFPDPDRWLWTDRSLSQASDWWSASFKANLLPAGASVVDACCGAGVDLVAIATRTEVIGIDYDPCLVKLAAANVRAHNLTAAVKTQAFSDGVAARLGREGWLHVDPDRRVTDSKTLDAEEFSPALDDILRSIENTAGAIIKISPRTLFSEDLHDWILHNCTRVWLGSQGECRQQLLLLGGARERLRAITGNSNTLYQAAGLSAYGQRWAIITDPVNGENSATDDESASEQLCLRQYEAFSGTGKSQHQAPGGMKQEAEVQEYLFDLHPALHAAELGGEWAARHGLKPITNELGYFTGNQPFHTAWAQCFHVLEVVAWDDRRVRKLLRKLEAGIVEIKCRLTKLDCNSLQRRYSKGAGRPLSLIVTRFGRRLRCIVAERLTRK